MIHRMYWVAVVALMALPAGAQDRGVLAIDEEAGRHAFSFDSEADAVNMCGTTGCEVVATFSACLALAYSRVTAQQEQSVWSWIEADTEGAAGREALDDCERSGGAACEVLNVYCVAAPATSRAAPAAAQQAPVPQATPEQETVFWQSIVNSTNAADFEAYLAQFPNGVFRLLAQNRLAALRAPAGDAPVAGGPRGVAPGRRRPERAGLRPRRRRRPGRGNRGSSTDGVRVGAGRGVPDGLGQFRSRRYRAAGDAGADQPGLLAGPARGDAGGVAGGDGDESLALLRLRALPGGAGVLG